ncbi:MAG TPA: hypothetical protein VKE71_05180 [Candidatus Angelobacter sp.]|nr:hypothetical protein [Candidatus Angelobacter sp.]
MRKRHALFTDLRDESNVGKGRHLETYPALPDTWRDLLFVPRLPPFLHPYISPFLHP